MDLPLPTSFAPMEAQTVDELPAGEGWLYEPKWDGFRCLAFRDGAEVELQSKGGKPLARYFPEMVAALRGLGARRFVLDGELAVPVEGRLDFDQLLQRIHPAASRVQLLSVRHPAILIVFDLLVDERSRSWADEPLSRRRGRLERFAGRYFAGSRQVLLSPATTDLSRAQDWYRASGADLDGVVAKRLDATYRTGERRGMFKWKKERSADCVVGGFRRATSGRAVGSLLLGFYDEDARLHHVGFTSSMPVLERRRLLPRLEALRGGPGFDGRAPGGPSRWNRGRSTEWEPLEPELVVEVGYDHFTGGRFRHGARFMRMRPDKRPRQCTFEQVTRRSGRALELISGP